MSATTADLGTLVRAPRVSLSHAWRYWLRNATIFKHTYKLSLLAWFFEPFFYLIAMGLGLGRYLPQVQGIKYIDFIGPGLVALTAMYGSTFEVTWNAFFKMDRGRIYEAAVSTPVALEDVALGEAMWATTRAMIYGGAFIVVAIPFGVVHSWWIVLAPFALALIGMLFALVGLSFTYYIKKIDFLSYYWTLFLTPMFMFSGIFFPLEKLPGWVQTLSWFMPLRHAVELMRALLLTGNPAAAARAAAWLAAVMVLIFPLPLNMLRRRLEN